MLKLLDDTENNKDKTMIPIPINSKEIVERFDGDLSVPSLDNKETMTNTKNLYH